MNKNYFKPNHKSEDSYVEYYQMGRIKINKSKIYRHFVHFFRYICMLILLLSLLPVIQSYSYVECDWTHICNSTDSPCLREECFARQVETPCFSNSQLQDLQVKFVNRSDIEVRLYKRGNVGTYAISTEVFRILLAELLGYNVTIVTQDNFDKSYLKMCQEGRAPDFTTEFWSSDYTSTELVQAFMGNCTDAGSTGLLPTNGWYIPNYVLDQPQYSSMPLDFWRAYTKPETITIFPQITAAEARADTEHEYFIPPQCEAQSCALFLGYNSQWDGGYLQQQIRNLQLLIIIFFPRNSAEYRLKVETSLNNREPFLFFMWSPDPNVSIYNITRIQFPFPTAECFRNWTDNLQGYGSVDCDFLPFVVSKLITTTPDFPPFPSPAGKNLLITPQVHKYIHTYISNFCELRSEEL